MNAARLRFATRAVLVVALGLSSRTAFAYCCTPAKSMEPPVCFPAITFPLTQAWNQRCIPFWVSTQGTLFDGENRALVAQSFNVWADQACTDLQFVDAGDTDDTEPGFNKDNPSANKNLVIELRDDQTGLLMRSDRLAVTITAFLTETGEILDADILINPNFNLAEVDPNSCNRAMNQFDIRNMLVHEVGHVIGFDHVPATQPDSTMFDSAVACEVKKRDLDPLDIQGLCAVYPAGEATRTCAPPENGYDIGHGESNFRDQCGTAVPETEDSSGCGCSATRSKGSLSSAGLMCALLMLSRLRRRSSLRSSRPARI